MWWLEGKHYYKLQGEELKKLRLENIELQISPMTRVFYLWTKRGASRHCKMLGTEKTIKTIPSYEVAEMMQKKHWEVLRMLDGGTDRKGIIEILNKNKICVSDYFIESAYVDNKGETRKCYECTKMGCDILANKMTGEKGILFTAKYVKRFKDGIDIIDLNTSDVFRQKAKSKNSPLLNRLWRIYITKSLCSPILGPHILSCQFNDYPILESPLRKAYLGFTLLKRKSTFLKRSCWISTSGYFYINTQLEGLES